MYLGRPQESPEQFLVVSNAKLHVKFQTDGDWGKQDFESAAAEPGSDLVRARRAITVLVGAVVRDLASIPQNSPLRAKHLETFGIFGALVPLYDTYIQDGVAPEVPVWTEFWSRAQPIILTLGMNLDTDGYGIKE